MSTEATFPVDPVRVEQLLRVQEQLLLGPIDECALGDRICQRTALVLGATGTRLARLVGDAGAEVAGVWGEPFAALDDDAIRRALTARRPLVDVDPAGSSLLTLPLDTAPDLLVMQLRRSARAPFSLEEIGLARYAASLAAVAWRRADGTGAAARLEPGPTEVLATLSHDLRQPLNVMLGYTELLLDDAYGPCNQEQRQILATIERHARELHTVLTGALDLARIEAQPQAHRPEPFAVAEVLRELCTGSLADRAGADVALTWHVDAATPPVCGDRFRVRQVLQNLIDNALRHTERGEVAVTAAPHEASIRVQVSDTGSGIHADDLPHLFSPFRTGREGRTGSGLGLYIVKRFCDSLGGHVSVASTIGTGTRFTIDLPTRPY